MALFITGVPAWIFWAVMALVFLVYELSTINLVSIWFALGSLAAVVVALLGGTFLLQAGIFLAVSALALTAFLYFRSKLKLSTKTIEKTNADRNIGKKGLVIEEINSLKATGQIKVEGRIWSAASKDDVTIEKDATVKVLTIKGVKLIVEEIMEDKEDDLYAK